MQKKLFYVVGGGLGHLSRIAAFIFTKSFNKNSCFILTNSPFAKKLFNKLNIITLASALAKNKTKLTGYIQKVIDNESWQDIYIDTFPFGILGELQKVNFGSVSLHYIARYVKQHNYFAYAENCNLFFKKTYIVDFLSVEQEHFIKKFSKKTISLSLKYQINKPDKQTLKSFSTVKSNWLIVHSSPKEELAVLIEQAKDLARIQNSSPRLLVISQEVVEDKELKYLDYFPAYNLFPYADKIFTACGYNLMKQTQKFRNKHIGIPFLRKYDDQFLRKKQMSLY